MEASKEDLDRKSVRMSQTMVDKPEDEVPCKVAK